MAFVFPTPAITAQPDSILSAISHDVTKRKLSADNTFAQKKTAYKVEVPD
jgi:hypothetical protein